MRSLGLAGDQEGAFQDRRGDVRGGVQSQQEADQEGAADDRADGQPALAAGDGPEGQQAGPRCRAAACGVSVVPNT